VLYARRLDSQEYASYFTMRLRRTGLGGRFNGVVVVSVPGSYFASFYNALLAGLTHYTMDLLESDGTVLVKYPAPTGPSAPQLPDPLLAKAVASEAATGIAESGTPFDGAGRLVAVRRVANYPIYVTVERAKASILHEWLQSIVGYIVVCVPAAIVLMALSVLALRRTRREQLAHTRASRAFERHAALEVQLHRAQRFETVGLLTAGFMHDFNNSLTSIRENIERLEATIEDPKVFTRPWKISVPLYRRFVKDAAVLEYKCVEFVEELLYGQLGVRDPGADQTQK